MKQEIEDIWEEVKELKSRIKALEAENAELRTWLWLRL